MSEIFHRAYNSARAHYSVQEWDALAPRQMTAVIYAEMRRIDAAIARGERSRTMPAHGSGTASISSAA